MHLAGACEQSRVIRRERFHRLPYGFHLRFAVFGEMFDAREQHYRRRILDHERVAIHPCRAAVANHARHAGVAAVVYRGIENALEDEALLIEVLMGVALGGGWTGGASTASGGSAGSAAPAARAGSAHTPASAAAASRGPSHRNPHIQRLPLGRREPLDHNVIGPGRERLAHPFAAFVRPVDL